MAVETLPGFDVIDGAHLSPCRTWRYSLTRDFPNPERAGTVTFIGLNPSTADETRDDPTIRRCVNFAKAWGFARLKMLNLYAYRATHPSELLAQPEPRRVGPENDAALVRAIGASGLVVCAWGNLGVGSRARLVLDQIADPRCLEVTKIGAPRHPLYVPASAQTIPYSEPS